MAVSDFAAYQAGVEKLRRAEERADEAVASAEVTKRDLGRGLHSSNLQLNLSRFCHKYILRPLIPFITT
jgi:hypothetical protein